MEIGYGGERGGYKNISDEMFPAVTVSQLISTPIAGAIKLKLLMLPRQFRPSFCDHTTGTFLKQGDRATTSRSLRRVCFSAQFNTAHFDISSLIWPPNQDGPILLGAKTHSLIGQIIVEVFDQKADLVPDTEFVREIECTHP